MVENHNFRFRVCNLYKNSKKFLSCKEPLDEKRAISHVFELFLRRI